MIYTFKLTAKEGYVDCLVYSHKSGYPWDADMDEDTWYSAAEGGHIDCLPYLHDSGCPWNGRVYNATEEGYLDCSCLITQKPLGWTDM